VSFFRDYFTPNGKRVEFWGPGTRSLLPLVLAIAPFLILHACGLRTIPSLAFWLAFGAAALLSTYLFSIGVMPWARRVTGKRKRDTSGN